MKALANWIRVCLLPLCLGASLAGCALPARSPGPQLYDLGPPSVSQPGLASNAPTLAVQIQAMPALQGTEMHYRLAYAQDKHLRAYALSRWAMPPADLLGLRVRDALGQGHMVLDPWVGGGRLLRLELEEFSQLFEAPSLSVGQLHLRATLFSSASGAMQAVAQRSVRVRKPATSADAIGGVQALAAASDEAAQQLAQWLQSLR